MPQSEPASEPDPRPAQRRTRRRSAGTVVAVAVLSALAVGCSGDSEPEGTPSRGPGGSPSASGSAGDPGARTPEGTLLVTDFGADTVTFVDPGDGAAGGGRAIGSVEVGTAPYGLAVDAEGRAWVATAEGVAVVDTHTRQRIARIPYETETGPVTTGEYRGGGMGIALAPDGSHAYVGVNVPDGNGRLEIIDTAKREVTDTVPVGRRPFDVDVSRDGSQVYATAHDSFEVTVVGMTDGDPGRPRDIEVAPYGTEGGLGSWLKPHYAAVRPSDGKLLLPFEGERLVVLDPRTGKSRIERMTANTHQHGAAMTEDGRLLVVGSGPIDPDEDEGPSLTVRRPDGTERRYPLEGPHETVTVSEDGGTAYVTGGFTRDGYWDGLTVIDLDSGDTHRLRAGDRPLDVTVLDG